MSSASTAGRKLICGASGSGKSSYAKQELRGRKRIVVFDAMDEYTQGRNSLCNVRCETLAEVKAAMRKDWSGFRIAYVPPASAEPRALSALSALLMAAQQPFKDGKSRAIVTLVIEEMNQCFHVHGGDAKAPQFAEICSRGRHYGIEVYGLSQRIAEIHTRFRGNCTETVILRQQGDNDTRAAMAVLGAPKATVQALKNLDYIHGKDGIMKRGRVTF